jgi:transposase
MKSCLVRFGVQNFKPTLRKAPERLSTLSTPEGVPLPPNTLLELRRDMARLRFVMDQIKEVEEARAQRLEQAPQELRDRRAVARYAGITGSPDESGSRRREKGLAKAGNARVRRGMIQLAWRFLLFQKDSALAHWYRTRTESAGKRRKTMIVALARKLLIALWRLVTTGEVPAGVKLSELANKETSSVSDDDPRWRSPEAGHGVDTGFENGSAAEELRRRCA